MKKHIIAAAVAAAVAVPAMAQNVEMYGSLDMSYGSGQITFRDGSKVTSSGINRGVVTGVDAKKLTDGSTVADSYLGSVEARGALTSSRIGVRGSEDLGSGMKANFNLEWELSPGQGFMNVDAMRTAIVGVSGGFGSVNIGRQLTGIHGVVVATSPLSGNNMVGDVVYSAGLRLHQALSVAGAADATVDPVTTSAGAGSASSAVRANNLIAYSTPTFSGVTVRVDLGDDAQKYDTSKATTSNMGLSANYVAGPLQVTAGTHTVSGKNGFTGASDDTKFAVNAIAAAYNFGFAKLNAIYGQNSVKLASVKTQENTVWQIGLSAPINSWVIAAQYGQGTRKSDGTGAGADLLRKQDYTGYQLAAIYNLSKRTNAYIAYGNDSIKEKNDLGNTTTDVFGNGTTAGDKTTRNQTSVGIRHAF